MKSSSPRTPGPGAYGHAVSTGKQPSSSRASTPSFGFGAGASSSAAPAARQNSLWPSFSFGGGGASSSAAPTFSFAAFDAAAATAAPAPSPLTVGGGAVAFALLRSPRSGGLSRRHGRTRRSPATHTTPSRLFHGVCLSGLRTHPRASTIHSALRGVRLRSGRLLRRRHRLSRRHGVCPFSATPGRTHPRTSRTGRCVQLDNLTACSSTCAPRCIT